MQSSTTRIIVAFAWAALPVASLRAQLEAPAPVELSRSVVTSGDRKVTYIELAPIPAEEAARNASLAARSAPPVSVPTAAERAEEARLAAKGSRDLALGATVYPGYPVLTELRWKAEGIEWRALSTADFRLLTDLGGFETDAGYYNYFVFLLTAPADDADRPRMPSLEAGGQAQFVVYADEATIAAHPGAFDGIAWLHRHYDAHRGELAARHAQREAEAAARALVVAPPKKKESVVRYRFVESTAATR